MSYGRSNRFAGDSQNRWNQLVDNGILHAAEFGAKRLQMINPNALCKILPIRSAVTLQSSPTGVAVRLEDDNLPYPRVLESGRGAYALTYSQQDPGLSGMNINGARRPLALDDNIDTPIA